MSLVVLFLVGGMLAEFAGAAEPRSLEETPWVSIPLEWWNGPSGTTNWLGARKSLLERGVTFTGFYRGTTYSTFGGKSQGTVFDNEIRMGLTLDLRKLSSLDWLEGWSVTGSVRWRVGGNPSELTGSTGVFAPSPWQSGKGWRLMPFYATWQSPDKRMIFRGGSINPYEFFLQVPAATLFLNSAFSASRGVSGTAVPWSSSYASWGGFLGLEPVPWWYIQCSLSTAIPGQANTANHGLNFSVTPDSGLFAVLETGFRPQWWKDAHGAVIPGRFGIGLYDFGVSRTEFDAKASSYPRGMYLFAQQQIWREPPGLNRLGKAGAASPEGWHLFSVANFAPQEIAPLPAFFNVGLVGEGILPSRPADLLGVAFATGWFSNPAKQNAIDLGLRPLQWEAVMEANYRFQMNQWAWLQPYLQLLINPGARGEYQNAMVCGMNLRCDF